MAETHVNITVEVEQRGNGLAIQTPVQIQLVRQNGKWHAKSESPCFTTESFDTMEQAIVAGAKQAHAELQTAVNDRPVIAGKITPETIRGMF